MIIVIINKILMTLFFMSLLNTLRHLYFFIQTYIQSNEENPIKYKLNDKSLFLLSISIGFILTVIFNGIIL